MTVGAAGRVGDLVALKSITSSLSIWAETGGIRITLRRDAPEATANEAVIRLAAYIYDQPNAGRGVMYANAMRSSGASAILLPYRIIRAGSTAEVG